MIRLAPSAVLIALCAGCASYSGGSLVPGRATEAEVEASMGPSAERRPGPNGEVVRYYSRLPSGREVYAARFGADGRLIAIEQRLTPENVALLVPGKSTEAEVRDLFGPPYRVVDFPRLKTRLWMYPMRGAATDMTLNVEFFADGRVREVRMYDEPTMQ
jgi:hypothetical protein